MVPVTMLNSIRIAIIVETGKAKGWYRIMKKAGTKLIQTSKSSGHCSANKPGWLNGAHPDKSGETVKRQYCFNWLRNNTEVNDCDASTDIMITNCNDFYVYWLNNINYINNSDVEPSCTYRYCTT